MRSLGGLLLMVGIGQAIFQIHGWLAHDYWPHFTNGDLLAELGVGFAGWRLGRAEAVLDLVLGAELSLTLIAVGAMTSLAGPLMRLYDEMHAAHVIRGNRRALGERREIPDPLATHH